MMKKSDEKKEKAMHFGVIDQNGKTTKREVTAPKKSCAKPKGEKGCIVFPFERTSVRSDAWRASEHIKLTGKRSSK